MRKLAMLLSLLLTCCASNPPVLVKVQYKPTKAGLIRLGDGPSDKTRPYAAALMKRFCAPDRAEIVTIDNQYGNSSTNVTMIGNQMFTSEDGSSEPYVHFQCVSPSEKARTPSP